MKWEYQTLKFSTSRTVVQPTDLDVERFTNALNAVGSEGWELVSVFSINSTEGDTATVNATLKRPI
jgi:hypothetical protein